MVIIHSVITTVFAWAEKEMIIPYNPARKATLPMKKDGKEADCLQPEELEQIMAALQMEDIDKRAMVTLFIVTVPKRGNHGFEVGQGGLSEAGGHDRQLFVISPRERGI